MRLRTRLFCLSSHFTIAILYLLTTPIFGTGHQTSNVSSAINSMHVFLDPDFDII